MEFKTLYPVKYNGKIYKEVISLDNQKDIKTLRELGVIEPLTENAKTQMQEKGGSTDKAQDEIPLQPKTQGGISTPFNPEDFEFLSDEKQIAIISELQDLSLIKSVEDKLKTNAKKLYKQAQAGVPNDGGDEPAEWNTTTATCDEVAQEQQA